MKFPNTSEEKMLSESGYMYAAGVDEAGRGAWAGPVVAAAVILGPLDNIKFFETFDGVRDSKLLTPKRREELFEIIKANSFGYGVGIGEREEIDKYGILATTKKAVFRSIKEISDKLDFVLVDALEFETFPVKYKAIIKGDRKVYSIAAASVIAKVTRDEMLKELSSRFPGYGFENHKGYGTREHQEALEKLGVCEIHRESYAPIRKILRGGDEMVL